MMLITLLLFSYVNLRAAGAICQERKQKEIVCENKGELRINCHGGRIRILAANYGRTRSDSQVCPYGKYAAFDVHCMTHNYASV